MNEDFRRRLLRARTDWIDRAVALNVMHQSVLRIDGKALRLQDGTSVVEFVSCSYLGLDREKAVIDSAKQALDEWGVHLCTARTRLSIGLNTEVEERLSSLFRRTAVTFPSVTTTHAAIIPLLAKGLLPVDGVDADTRLDFVLDRSAHASMQNLRPYLQASGQVRTIPHNDMNALEDLCRENARGGRRTVYFCDGVYSMGGECPLDGVRGLVDRYGLIPYIDDAHGTSVVGPKGEGFVRTLWPDLPGNVFVNFSLSKGFGCNGGGVLLPDRGCETALRRLGMPYAFSGPLDFSILGAVRAALTIHESGGVVPLQERLRRNVRLFDSSMYGAPRDGVSAVRAIPMKDEDAAIDAAAALRSAGYFVSAAFFPVVSFGEPILRVVLSALHTEEQIAGLVRELRRLPAA
ncbi:MAG: aminotransferase class I/II-fold pyridoxal phosphate-dependent enzyme [Elusimicrobiota bacterium]|jgi:7-keto-8-aminopelargonate synthetase-like enzyme